MTEGVLAAKAAAGPRPAPPVGFYEFWPSWAFYTPVVLQWVLLSLRHGSVGTPTAANPTIETGGLCGESKSSILDQMAEPERAAIAPYAIMDGHDLEAARRTMRRAGLAFPLVAKPDIGCNGTGVRLVANEAELDAYLRAFPRGPRIMLQALIPHEGEAGLFYVRRPGAARGRITSVTLKHAPVVAGDGRRSLRTLIEEDPRLGRIAGMFLPRLADRLHEVPPLGERVRLVFVGNHCKGSLFEDGRAHVTEALEARIERLARAIPEFSFGRFDVRYESLGALRRGEGFSIIEVNGVGSEATHIWDPRTRIVDAWIDQLAHYGAAFAIGAANRARGLKGASALQMWRSWRAQKRLMASYPQHD